MTNLRPTIVPKSDQLNSDDLIGRTLTIKITKVALCGEADQPVAVHFEGDDGKPWKPCKSMRRVLINVWGDDGNAFVGRRLTLYRDERVQFGGMAVGGIRISHMSDIDHDITMALTATRANRKPFTVKPLAAGAGDARPLARPAAVDLEGLLAAGRAAALQGEVSLQGWWGSLSAAEKVAAKPTLDSTLKPLAKGAITRTAPGYDDDGDDTPADTFTAEEAEAAAEAKPALPAGMKRGSDLLAETKAAERPVLAPGQQVLLDNLLTNLRALAETGDVAGLEEAWARSAKWRGGYGEFDPIGGEILNATFNDLIAGLV